MTIEEWKAEFVRLYGEDGEPIRVFHAPGRVNLIGEHTDYNGGLVFPTALTLGTTLLARQRQDNTIRMKASDLEDLVTLDIHQLDSYRDLKWGNYQAGVLYELQQAGYPICGCDLLYHDTVPHGSGLSSSAANEVVTAYAFATFAKDGKAVDPIALAKLAQKAENEYAGVNCGIMDQFASANGKAGFAICLDCRNLSYELVPLNLKGYKLILANTNKKHKLGASKYNERRQECEVGLQDLQQAMPEIRCLGDVTVEAFEANCGVIDDPVVRKRVEHVVMEDERVKQSVAALQKGDIKAFGRYMNESHDSLRDRFEVTGAELDCLAEEARKLPYVLGARMTGGGFGGCTVNIVEEAHVDDFIQTVGKQYTERIGYAPSFIVSESGDGARELQ